MIAVMFSTLTSFTAVLSNKTLSAFSCSATETMGVFRMASVKLVRTVLLSSFRVWYKASSTILSGTALFFPGSLTIMFTNVFEPATVSESV